MSHPASGKSSKPIVWFPFAAGGTVAALIAPVLILVLGILPGLGILPPAALSHERMLALLTHPLGKLVLLGAIIPMLWHGAHRFRMTLQDLGVRHDGPRLVVALACYAFGGLFTLMALAVVLAVW